MKKHNKITACLRKFFCSFFNIKNIHSIFVFISRLLDGNIYIRGGVIVSVTIDISPDILLWIKKQLLPPDVIDTLDQWSSGDKVPNVSTIRNFSKKTHIPFGYFFLKTPPIEELTIAHCRTINKFTVTKFQP